MTRAILLTAGLTLAGVITAWAQQGQPADPRRTPGLMAQQDPNRQAFVQANCMNPPPTPAPRGGGAGRAGGPAQPQPTQDYRVTAIPGVIAADRRWTVLFEDTGNNADGVLALDDGSLLVAQPARSVVVRIDRDGKSSIVYTNTFTGAGLSRNSKGQIFIAERALGKSIWMLEPERRLFADTFKGEPFDCIGPAVLNDIAADAKGGVYMTMGGVYYANPQGVVTGRFGTVVGNGIVLSPNGQVLYVTGRVVSSPTASGPGDGRGGAAPNTGGLVAFDVQPDGSLTGERQFAETCTDGSTVDAAGRIYCIGARMPDPADPAKVIVGIGVFSPIGQMLGIIPTPRNLAGIAFGGPNQQTLFGTAFNDVQVISIEMVAAGHRPAAK